MSDSALTHFQLKKLQPTTHTSKTDRMRASKEGLHYRIWTYTYFVSIAAFQTSSSYVLGWGSPMTCNKKKYGLKEDKGEREDSGEKHALEKHAWKFFSGKDGKSWREATSKKSCNRAHVIKQENSNDLNMLLFQMLLRKPLSLLSFPLLLSPSPALVSPFSFDPTPISSRQFPVCNFRKDEKRKCIITLSYIFVNAHFGARMHFYTLSLQKSVDMTSFLSLTNMDYYSCTLYEQRVPIVISYHSRVLIRYTWLWWFIKDCMLLIVYHHLS